MALTKTWKADGMPLGIVVPNEYVIGETTLMSGDTYKSEYTFVWSEDVLMPKLTNATQNIDVFDPKVARDKALAYVNTARAALGFDVLEELPSGKTRRSDQCVIARALPNVIGVGSHISFRDAETARIVGETWATPVMYGNVAAVICPSALMAFISGFDNYAYPDLVAL